ncbi:MAG: Asp-tRNA(Asn)/Glu-tRNA(Gln) amidotransferase subunit GatA [Candidatus Marinimicrobia bacterium]|nr:Asp-tRNA(Asn)/Glu-tRNA(Gln) amidotransferase subunit GatA [Candidatus Neomarinimicrobiota bacterium]
MKNYLSLKEIQQDIYLKNTSCEKLVRGYLSNVAKKRHLNAFIETYDIEAIKKACEIDKKIKNKKAGKLAGLVVGLKDNICYQNHHSEAGSQILKNFKSIYSATVVERLLNEDAIILGRLNCDEFAMGSSTETSIYGSTKNPINNLYVSGGSSGGSSTAVKANLCHVALGTDTGGSIRQPAAFCGVIGLKPTYGLVSRHGLIAYASSFDQIGPIAKSTYDILAVMSVISGKDDFDSTCIGENIENQKLTKNPQKRFAVLKEALEFPEINKGIKREFQKLIKNLENQGHIINYINIPLLKYLVPTYYILTTAEASSNLSRYDGIQFGYQNKTNSIDGLISTSRSLGFGQEVKRRILLGTYILSEGYYDEYYTKAQKIRRLIQEQTKNILLENDYILLPTSPNIPFKLGKKNLSSTQLYFEDIFTVQANLSGHPAISFPLGEAERGFFASAQIIGDFFSEKSLIDITNTILA